MYDRHADGLYRQALLTLGDAGMAEQVVCDVIVDECTRVPVVGGWRWRRELPSASVGVPALPGTHLRAGKAQPSPRVASVRGVAGCIDPQGFLSREERGALGPGLAGARAVPRWQLADSMPQPHHARSRRPPAAIWPGRAGQAYRR
jgi:hypothetical protein